MTRPTAAGDEGQRVRRMTVAHVRVHNNHPEVVFVESARIYRVARDNPAYNETLDALRAAAANQRPLLVRFDTPNGDVIESARADDSR